MVEFPLPSLRQFLLPDQVVLFKTFEATTVAELDELINRWVASTKNIIAVPGPVHFQDGKVSVPLTYVAAVEGNKRD